MVGLVLTTVQEYPWLTDAKLALKRILIVVFPASMSAAVSDTTGAPSRLSATHRLSYRVDSM